MAHRPEIPVKESVGTQPPFKDLFDDFDTEKTGSLSEAQLQQLLTKVNSGRDVPAEDVRFVMETADVLSDGRIGKYEVIGAIGAWYSD